MSSTYDFARHLILALALALMIVATYELVQAPDLSSLPLCEHEDGSGTDEPCLWDAQRQGNGQGTSTIHNAQ